MLARSALSFSFALIVGCLSATPILAADEARITPEADVEQEKSLLSNIRFMESQLDSLRALIARADSTPSQWLFERDEISSELREAYDQLANLRADRSEARRSSPSLSLDVPSSVPASQRAPRQKLRSYNELEFGEDVIVYEDEIVKGDVMVFNGDVRVDGIVEGDILAIGGNIELGRRAQVLGQVVVFGGDLNLHPTADIQLRPVTLAVPLLLNEGGSTNRWLALLMDVLKFGFLALFAGLLLVAIPRRLGRATAYLDGAFLRCFGFGLLALLGGTFSLGVCMILLMITIVGIPVAVALMVLFGLVLVWALFVAVFLVGNRFGNVLRLRSLGPLASILLGCALFLLPEFIDDILILFRDGGESSLWMTFSSVLLATLLSACGLGALILTRFGKHRGLEAA